jgi:hypothetical protein
MCLHARVFVFSHPVGNNGKGNKEKGKNEKGNSAKE